jgi:heparin/heparan-sulfate lyase
VPEDRKAWLLHVKDEPRVDGRLLTADSGKGRLFCETVLPEDATLEKIGGPGKEFWSNGKNWEPDVTFLAAAARGAKRTGRGPYMGAWRLEVAPGAPRSNDRFLHVLTATDTSATRPQVERIKTDACDGVTIAVGATKATVLFNRTGAVGGMFAFGNGSERPLATTVQPQAGLAPLD